MATVRHRHTDNKVLFDYNKVSSLPVGPDRVIFLSERDFYILLNSIEFIGKFRKRVYIAQENELYTLCSDQQWQDFRWAVEELENNLGGWVMSNEFLERIAIALETMVQEQEGQVLNLSDIAEVLGLNPSEDTEDLLEAFEYMAQLLPGLPELTIPKPDLFGIIGQMRTNGAFLQLLRDISLSQRAQAVSLGGIDAAGLYDVMGETAESLIVKAGWQGRAYWLWRWISNDQIPGWTAWLSQISALIFGSIRGATYDLVDAVEALDLQGIQDAIRESTDTTIINCNNCTTNDIYNTYNQFITKVYGSSQVDSSWPVQGTPPVSDDATYTTPASPATHKCTASNFLVGWLIDFFGDETFTIGPGDNLLTIVEKISAIINNLKGVGIPLAILSVLAGRVLAYVTNETYDIFQTIEEVLDDLEDFLVCVLNDSTDRDAAIADFRAYLVTDGRLLTADITMIILLLESNNVLANLYYENDQIPSGDLDQYGTVCACGNPIFTINPFNPSVTITEGSFQDGEETTVEAAVRNYYGNDRAGMNLMTFPDGEAGPNRRVRIIAATGITDPYITLVHNGVPDGGGTPYTLGQMLAIDDEINGIQIVHQNIDTNLFTVTFIVETLP